MEERQDINLIVEASKRKKLHPLWMVFSFGYSLKEMVFPALFFVIFQLNSSSSWVPIGFVAIAVFFGYRLLSIPLSWRNFSYEFGAEELTVEEGRLHKKKRFISLDQIQYVQLHTHFLHRFFGLTKVTLDTESEEKDASVTIELIKRSEAERIQTLLSERQDIAVKETGQQHDGGRVIYQVTLKDTVFASLTSLRFLVSIPIFGGIIFKANKIFDIESFLAETLIFLQTSWIWMTVAGIVFFLISNVFGVLLTFLRYGHFKVDSQEDVITIQKGIVTTTEFQIQKKNIQAVKFTSSFIRRFFGIIRVELVCSGAESDDNLESTVLFPFISKKRAFLLLPNFIENIPAGDSLNKLPKQALWVKLLNPSILWLVVVVVQFYWWPEKWYISLGLLLIIMMLRILEYFYSSYSKEEDFLRLTTGSLSLNGFMVNKKKIEELTMSESWLQRKFGLCTLQVSTKGTLADVQAIKDIPRDVGETYFSWYKERGKTQETYSRISG
ncbi:PH domain-containing protein [Bacillus sp. 2205SS5-2]|uniref:PH domain-containing protein n=1 Tax=Bacillus sp. 2205SS5-2 TaxID=3109031 RepID=UPI003003DA7A